MRNWKTPILTIFTALLTGCGNAIHIEETADENPHIYPDYSGVTIPVNIAPLNFTIMDEGADHAAIIYFGEDSLIINAQRGDVDIPISTWKKITASQIGDSIKITTCTKGKNGRWKAYAPIYIHVSPDSIDNTIIYRKIPPLYGVWKNMGIYQRNLENFDEKAIYENKAIKGNCVNCHSLCAQDPQKMLFHLRAEGAGTYIYRDNTIHKLDTKTDSTISTFTYPYWHPGGKYVAFSVNDIFQVFHNSDPNITEVIDEASDIVVYNIDTNSIITTSQIKSDKRLETFPAFSPDGLTLYYCSAETADSLPQQYKEIRYELCAIPFDPTHGTFGTKADTLTTSSLGGKSVALPRPSPDGKWIIVTTSAYGNFMIWHNDADLWIYDKSHKTWHPMTQANSDRAEGYHSWSSNSRWVVYGSRRDDGLYTRPYFTHISEDGKETKPFMLPQKKPKKYYTNQKESYNIPEFSKYPVDIDTRQVTRWAKTPAQKVNPK